MTDSDLTLKVLVEMRDELRVSNRQLGELGERVDRVAERVDRVVDRVDRIDHRLETMDHRLETIEHTMVDFGTQVVLLGRYMKHSVTRHASDVERHDEEISDLRTRVEKLEAKD